MKLKYLGIPSILLLWLLLPECREYIALVVLLALQSSLILLLSVGMIRNQKEFNLVILLPKIGEGILAYYLGFDPIKLVISSLLITIYFLYLAKDLLAKQIHPDSSI